MALTAAEIAKARLQVQEADAKRVGITFSPAIGRIEAVRRWKVNAELHADVLEYLDTYGYDQGTDTPTAGQSVPSARVGDEVLPGTCRVVLNSDGTQSGDPGYVYQTIRVVHQPTTADDLAALSALVTQEEAIVRPFGFTSGTVWDRAYIFYDIDPAKKATLEALTGAALASALAGSGWTYADRKFQEADDNTAIFIVLVRKVQWLNRWVADLDNGIPGARIVAETNPNDATEKTKTKEATGISEANLAADYATAKTDTAGDGWVVESASRSEGQDGERTIRTGEGGVNELGEGDPTASDSLTINLTPEIGIKNATATRRWKRVSKAYKDALVAAGGLARSSFTCPETEDTTYTHVEVSITDHGNDVYTVTQSGYNFAYLLIDVHQDVRGRAVYQKDSAYDGDPDPLLYVRWPIYRSYHIFRTSWINCWNGCDAKKQGGTYPIVGDIQIGSFGSYCYHGRVTTFRGWTNWELASAYDGTADQDD